MNNIPQEDSLGDCPVDHSLQEQFDVKTKEDRTSDQSGTVQQYFTGTNADEHLRRRQEQNPSGESGEANSEKTAEAVRKSSLLKKRLERIAVGKSGQGAMRNESDPRDAEKFDDFSDISPGHRRS